MLEDLAQALARAWLTGETLPLPVSELAPCTRNQAFAVQDRMAAILGDRCIGWKVGAAVRAVQIMEGHDGPITGRLLAPRLFASPAALPASRFSGYKVECEFAFHFTRDVPLREVAYTRAELDPLLVLHPGLELAGSRFSSSAQGRKPTTYDTIADNGACGAYIVGEGIEDWRHIDFTAVSIEARLEGGPPIRVFSGDYFRDPVDILVETVNGLSERGIGLVAGDLLTTGSLTVPTPIQAGQSYSACFEGLATLSVALE